MVVVVAGTRSISLSISEVEEIAEESGIEITEVVCGKAPGIDTSGELWANSKGIPVKPFPALWDDLDVPNARIKISKFGKPYNANAGSDRNLRMAQYAKESGQGALILIFDGKSPGSTNMLGHAKRLGLTIFQKILK